MKKTWKLVVGALICTIMLVCAVGCGKEEAADLWSTAKYTEDAELGEGSKTVQVEVEVEEKSITFTIATDKELLGDILMEHELLAGEDSEYGLYIKEVNGIEADYDTDKAYWALYKDGEYSMTGVDTTEVSDGEHYELVYTKE